MEPGTHPIRHDLNESATLHQHERIWREPIIQKIRGFSKLSENWDSYGAAIISPICINFAVELCEILYSSGVLKPYVFPSPLGGVQLEWHQATADLEIEILPDGSIEALFEYSGNAGEQKFSNFDNMFSNKFVRDCLSALSDADL